MTVLSQLPGQAEIRNLTRQLERYGLRPSMAVRLEADAVSAQAVAAYARMPDSQLKQTLSEAIVRHFAGLAEVIASHYGADGDIRQVAYKALFGALQKYDPDKGNFTKYAAVCIRGEIMRYFRDHQRTVRLKRPDHDILENVKNLDPRLSPKDMAERIGVSTQRLLRAMAAGEATNAISLSILVGPDGEYELGSVLGGTDPVLEAAEDRQVARSLFRKLLQHEDTRLPVIVFMRFYQDLTLAEIAQRLGMSAQHVNRLLQSAIAYMRLNYER